MDWEGFEAALTTAVDSLPVADPEAGRPGLCLRLGPRGDLGGASGLGRHDDDGSGAQPGRLLPIRGTAVPVEPVVATVAWALRCSRRRAVAGRSRSSVWSWAPSRAWLGGRLTFVAV